MSHAPIGNPGVRVPPPLLFVGGFAIALFIQRTSPWRLLGGGVARPAAGWTLVIVGLVTMYWGIATFVNAGTAVLPTRPASRLVRSGPYRFTRNPMYLGLTTAYLGGTLVVDSVWPLLVLPIVLGLLYLFVITREERYLSAEFGAEYEEYRSRVRRWL
jgi:protein-S-isoprenylcysteine O-methyltransferase Ste14